MSTKEKVDCVCCEAILRRELWVVAGREQSSGQCNAMLTVADSLAVASVLLEALT